ncbi:MAG: ribonuclease E/G, partial [Actinomycetales bacterium]
MPETSDDAPAAAKPAKRTTKRSSAATSTATDEETDGAPSATSSPAFITPIFQAAEPAPRKRTVKTTKATTPTKATKATTSAQSAGASPDEVDEDLEELDEGDDEGASGRRRSRRGGRGRRRRADGERSDGDGADSGDDESADVDEDADGAVGDDEEGAGSTRRRRRRRRSGDADPLPDDPPNTVVRVREPREARAKSEDAGSLRGSTRLEAKKQRRREGREAGHRRAPILTEAEFLARREAVNRVMAVRQVGDRTQIAVLEDGILVEHYVTRGAQGSLVGNVYLGRVQNVLPSMEAAFVDIGRKRNAVLYAGEVNWDAAGLEGQPKRSSAATSTATDEETDGAPSATS